jgi:hypothetical protein
MTYEEKVHYFGLRWIMDNSSSVARLREFDTTRLITIHEQGEDYGCSCDYDYRIERCLVVPTFNGQTFSVQLDLTFAEVMQGILDAEPVELSGVADYVMAGQAEQIEKLKAELAEKKKELAVEKRQHTVLQQGLKSQTALWRFLRNLYKDLQDRKLKTPDALDDEDMLELVEHLYRELDLWFNENIDTTKATFTLNVGRSA